MIKNLTFSEALSALKLGMRISRENWNGKNMFLYLNKGSIDISTLSNEDSFEIIEGIPGKLFDTGDKGTFTRLPNINMSNANSRTVTGWLASQTDLLAEDWCILPI